MFHTNLAKWCAVSIVFITVLFLYFLSGSYSGFMLFSKPTVTSPKTFARHKEATAVTILRNVVSEKNGKIKVEEKTAVDHVTFTEKELRSAAASNCHYFQSLDDLDGVELSDGTLMALGTYKKKKRDEFLRNFPHPPPKNTPRQKIKPQLVSFVCRSWFSRYTQWQLSTTFSENILPQLVSSNLIDFLLFVK